MRWSRLFDDLSAQLDDAERADRDAEVSDRRRLEVSRQRFGDRLLAATGATVSLGLHGCPVLRGQVQQVGPDWMLLTTAVAESLVALEAVTWVEGLSPLTGQRDDVVADRLGIGYPLRQLARDRAPVTLLLRDGTALTGTIDRVGADMLDLAEHPGDEPRRQDAVARSRAVPFAALAVVRPA